MGAVGRTRPVEDVAPAQRSLASHVEDGHSANWRSRAAAPHRQADEGKLAAAEQLFQIEQALDMGDVEAGLVHEVFMLPAGPGRIESMPE